MAVNEFSRSGQFPIYGAVGGDGAEMPDRFDSEVRRDYGPQGCAGIVVKTAAFLALVAVLTLLRLAGVQ